MKKKEVYSIISPGYGTEAHLHRANYPRCKREELFEEEMGLAFFRNGVHYIRNHLR